MLLMISAIFSGIPRIFMGGSRGVTTHVSEKLVTTRGLALLRGCSFEIAIAGLALSPSVMTSIQPLGRVSFTTRTFFVFLGTSVPSASLETNQQNGILRPGSVVLVKPSPRQTLALFFSRPFL